MLKPLLSLRRPQAPRNPSGLDDPRTGPRAERGPAPMPRMRYP